MSVYAEFSLECSAPKAIVWEVANAPPAILTMVCLLEEQYRMNIPTSADKWCQAMERTPEGKKILENVRKEENVPAKVAKAFFAKVSRNYDSSADPVAHMRKNLNELKSAVLCGPSRELGLQLLTRFARMARLANDPALKKAGVSYQRLSKNPSLITRIAEMEIGNRGKIVWAALEEPVSKDIEKNPVKVLNKMGITDKFEESWFQIVYNAGDTGLMCHVPTVLDRGANQHFKPAPKDADSGTTSPCSGKEKGYPEYVHGKCKIDQPALTPYVFGG